MWSSNAQVSKAQRQGTIAILCMSLLCVSLICVSLIGCTHSDKSKNDGSKTASSGVKPIDFAIDTVTIAAIKQAPVSTIDPNKSVQIQGKVGNRAPLLGKTAYELQDATGRIWVLANDSIPNVGDDVVIQGKLLYQSIRLNGKEQGSVYVEQQQRVR